MSSAEEEEVSIVPYRDGPLIVRGPVVLRDQDGNVIDAGRSPVALCRCGRSRIRPFCDGTHAVSRFSAPSGRETDRGRGRESPREVLEGSPGLAGSAPTGDGRPNLADP